MKNFWVIFILGSNPCPCQLTCGRAADGGMTRASEPRSKNFVTGIIVNVKLSNLYMNTTVILVIKKMAIMRTK